MLLRERLSFVYSFRTGTALWMPVANGTILTKLPAGIAVYPCTSRTDKKSSYRLSPLIGSDVMTVTVAFTRGSTMKFLPVCNETVSISEWISALFRFKVKVSFVVDCERACWKSTGPLISNTAATTSRNRHRNSHREESHNCFVHDLLFIGSDFALRRGSGFPSAVYREYVVYILYINHQCEFWLFWGLISMLHEWPAAVSVV